MYRCQQCNSVVPKRVPRQCIITYRDAYYPHRRGIHKKMVIEKGRKVEKWFDDPGGKGREIAYETQVCVACMAQYHAQERSQTVPTPPPPPLPKLNVPLVPDRHVGSLRQFRDRHTGL